MRKMLTAAVLSAMTLSTVTVAVPASARSHRHVQTYHGRDGRYYHRCRGGNGAVGTVAGGVGGALLGHAVGGGTLGTIAGGVGGGLLGRHLDKAHTRHRNGC